MRLKSFLDIASVCGASILIGTLAVFYFAATWLLKKLFSRGVTLIITILSVSTIYAYGFWVFLAAILNLLTFLLDQLPFIFDLFSKDKLNPSQLPNFSGILEAVGVFFAYFIAMAAFFTLFFYLKDIVVDSLGDIKLFMQWMLSHNNNRFGSSLCSICLS